MSLDQRLSQAARRVAHDLTPPEIDLGAVRSRARSKRRRTAALAGTVAVLAIVAAGAALDQGRPTSAPVPVVPAPTPSPIGPGWTPDTITAEEIVKAADAKATAVGVALDDTDTRLAIWTSVGYAGVALTTDGYRTATYTSIPGTELGGFRVIGLPGGLFLVTNPGDTDWLVGVDGTVRPVVRAHGEVPATDDALWFACNDGGWRDTWCSLDPSTARASVWPRAWNGSAVPPQGGAKPWGANPEPRAVGNTGLLEAWWVSSSGRQVRTLTAARYGDYVLGCPSDLMALWSTGADGSTVDLHTSRDRGATWQVSSYRTVDADQWWKVRCAPDGGYLAVDSERGAVVWRAEKGDDAFRKVYDAPGTAESIGSAELWTTDGRVFVSGEGVVAISVDSGKTWTRVSTWR